MPGACMARQLMLPRKVPDAYPDYCLSPMRTTASEAMYAPLYKADNRTDISLIESPFSQSLTISGQGPARDAPWVPQKKLGSPFMSAPAGLPGKAGGTLMQASTSALADAGRLSSSGQELTCPVSAPGQKLTGIMSADVSSRREGGREATWSALQSQRSSSVETGKSRIKMGKRTRQAKEADDLQVVLRYNLALQARTTELEKKLAVKDREIATITLEMQMLQPSPLESGRGIGSLESDDGKAQSLPAELLRSSCSASAFEQDAQALRLQKFYDAHGLRGADMTGRGIEDGVMRQLKSLVAEGCEMAEQMLTPQSRCHCMLPLVTMEHSAALPEQARLWRTILQKMELSQTQRQQITLWHASLLKQMQLLQNHRHSILSQMMHTLLPGGLLLHADAPKAFCNQLQSEGTLPLMKVNMDASSAARRLEESLAQERKLFAEGNTVMLQTILSPIQAGLLMLEAWPAHCDCFAFAAAAIEEARQ